MKKLIKNISIVGLLLLGVACKGPNGGPGMSMSSCDQAKNEVREILTGKSKSCSGLVSAAMTAEEGEVELAKRWELEENGQFTIVSIKNGGFYTIQEKGNKILAFRGSYELEGHAEENKIVVTAVFAEMVQTATMTIENGTLTDGVRVYNETGVDSEMVISDEDITVVRTQEELDAFLNSLTF